MFTEKDKNLISELSLQNLSEEQQSEQLQSFYETLKKKVGMTLEDSLSDEQLAEFEKINKSGDEKAIESWLHSAIPNYDSIVKEEELALVEYIKQSTANYRKIVHSETE